MNNSLRTALIFLSATMVVLIIAMRVLNHQTTQPVSSPLPLAAEPFSWTSDPEIQKQMIALKQNPNTLNYEAIRALAQIGPRAIPALCDGLLYPSWFVQIGSVKAIETMLEAHNLPEDALPCLEKANLEGSAEVKMALPGILNELKAHIH